MARDGSPNGRVWADAEIASLQQDVEINAHAADVNHAKWQEAQARAEAAEAEAAEYRRKLRAARRRWLGGKRGVMVKLSDGGTS